MDCPECGHSNRAGALFCKQCGICIAPAEVLTRACPSCGIGGRPTAVYCVKCGLKLIAADEWPGGDAASPAGRSPGVPAPGTVDREKVMSTITDLFGMLEQESVEYSFLSVDVAGSGDLKRGQKPVLVELSFRAYQQWVAAVVSQYGGEIHSTAGDGAMCRFQSAPAAVNAGKEIQRQLSTFNQRQNRMSKPFAIRCGVHSGEVVAQEGAPVAQVFSVALDVAAHLQQVAPSGAVAISAATHRSIPDQASFQATSVVVDEELVYLWPPTCVEPAQDGA